MKNFSSSAEVSPVGKFEATARCLGGWIGGGVEFAMNCQAAACLGAGAEVDADLMNGQPAPRQFMC